MLEEAQRLKQEGVDVVVGYFESHGRKDTIEKVKGLEAVPRRKIQYRGATFEEMDTPAVLKRRPAVCLVDELAHTNIPGSERSKRWEDVLILLDAGIDVYTTMNVQHLESLNDQVQQITGIRMSETIPDWVIKEADEVVMTDATPEALLNRLKRGVIYDPEKAQRALENFFRESNLVALRELALRQTAHEVELRLEEGDRRSEIPSKQAEKARAQDAGILIRERILIHITADPSAAMLIRRGRRVADYLRADCFAVYVCPHPDLSVLQPEEREAVEKHLNFARNLHIETRVLQGNHVAETIVDFARRQRVTQILLARINFRPWTRFLGGNVVSQVVRAAEDIRITIVADRRRAAR
jgi:two-component system sensor histidine kinase KdpD